MPKGFLVRRRREHFSHRCTYERDDIQNVTPVWTPLLFGVATQCTTKLEESVLSIARHAVITDLTPPSSPAPTLVSLLAGAPVFQLPASTSRLSPVATHEKSTMRAKTSVPSPSENVLQPINANKRQNASIVPKRPAKKLKSKENTPCGDIDPSFNIVTVTADALAELNRIENRLGDYICRLCDQHFDDAFLLAKHRCVKIVNKDYPCIDCDKVFSYAAHLASHRRWHRLRAPKQAPSSSPLCIR